MELSRAVHRLLPHLVSRDVPVDYVIHLLPKSIVQHIVENFPSASRENDDFSFVLDVPVEVAELDVADCLSACLSNNATRKSLLRVFASTSNPPQILLITLKHLCEAASFSGLDRDDLRLLAAHFPSARLRLVALLVADVTSTSCVADWNAMERRMTSLRTMVESSPDLRAAAIVMLKSGPAQSRRHPLLLEFVDSAPIRRGGKPDMEEFDLRCKVLFRHLRDHGSPDASMMSHCFKSLQQLNIHTQPDAVAVLASHTLQRLATCMLTSFFQNSLNSTVREFLSLLDHIWCTAARKPSTFAEGLEYFTSLFTAAENASHDRLTLAVEAFLDEMPDFFGSAKVQPHFLLIRLALCACSRLLLRLLLSESQDPTANTPSRSAACHISPSSVSAIARFFAPIGLWNNDDRALFSHVQDSATTILSRLCKTSIISDAIDSAWSVTREWIALCRLVVFSTQCSPDEETGMDSGLEIQLSVVAGFSQMLFSVAPKGAARFLEAFLLQRSVQQIRTTEIHSEEIEAEISRPDCRLSWGIEMPSLTNAKIVQRRRVDLSFFTVFQAETSPHLALAIINSIHGTTSPLLVSALLRTFAQLAPSLPAHVMSQVKLLCGKGLVALCQLQNCSTDQVAAQLFTLRRLSQSHDVATLAEASLRQVDQTFTGVWREWLEHAARKISSDGVEPLFDQPRVVLLAPSNSLEEAVNRPPTVEGSEAESRSSKIPLRGRLETKILLRRKK